MGDNGVIVNNVHYGSFGIGYTGPTGRDSTGTTGFTGSTGPQGFTGPTGMDILLAQNNILKINFKTIGEMLKKNGKKNRKKKKNMNEIFLYFSIKTL